MKRNDLSIQQNSPRIRPTLSTWIVGVIALGFLVLFTVTNGVAGFLTSLALVAFITGLYVAISGRQSWALIRSRRVGGIIAAAGLVLFFVGFALASLTAGPPQTQPSPHPSYSAARPTPSPTPTPTAATLDDYTGQPAIDAQTALNEQGFLVSLRDQDGAVVSDATGWIVQSQSPLAGNTEPTGTTVTLVITPPASTTTPAPPAPPAPNPGPGTGPGHHQHPGAPGAPKGATAKCRDGSYSTAKHQRQACDGHGGIAVWYR
jgi:hypothetical protein